MSATHPSPWTQCFPPPIIPARKPLSALSDEEISQAVRRSRLLAQVLKALGFRQSGGRQTALKKRIAAMGLDTSHLLCAVWRRGSTVPMTPARPLTELLIAGRLVPTKKLKMRLIAQGLRGQMRDLPPQSLERPADPAGVGPYQWTTGTTMA